jgi:hypothetical protein
LLKQTAEMGEAVAIEFGATRDSIGQDYPLLPPGDFTHFDTSKAPEHDARSFLIEESTATRSQIFGGREPDSHLDYFEHPLYTRYMQLPKGLLSPNQVGVLYEVHEGLTAESATRFLFTGGWAAAEAAIVMKDMDRGGGTRTRLLEAAGDAWLRAHDRAMAVRAAGEETPDHYSLKERIELALASIPLLEGIVTGDVRVKTLERVASDYAQVAIENLATGQSKRKSGDVDRALFHEGLDCEVLALLGLNKELTTRRFGTPSTARNDSGYFFPKLTHDLMLFRQRGGQLKSILPAEVKTRVRRHDKKRYKALLIDSEFMDEVEAGEPGPMLELYARVYLGGASGADMAIAENLTRRMWAMVSQYSAGSILKTECPQSVIQFHDASKVTLGGYAMSATRAS